MDGRTNQWMNEWMDGRMNELVNDCFGAGFYVCFPLFFVGRTHTHPPMRVTIHFFVRFFFFCVFSLFLSWRKERATCLAKFLVWKNATVGEGGGWASLLRPSLCCASGSLARASDPLVPCSHRLRAVLIFRHVTPMAWLAIHAAPNKSPSVFFWVRCGEKGGIS